VITVVARDGRMKRYLIIIAVLLGVYVSHIPAHAADDLLPEWLPRQSALCGDSYRKEQFDIFEDIAEANGLDGEDSKVREHVARINFLHKLFTSEDSVDAATGGWLNIPYFWHWVTPNRRHSITYTPTGKRLSKVSPPKRFGRYKSRADIDRIPSIYLADLVEDVPLYKYPGVGEFTTFGWCSEREMSFSALLTLLGYKAKIVQQGPHVWSEVLVDAHGRDGNKIKMIARVDNTYDTVEWLKLETSQEKWASRIGSGESIRWYNKMATDPKELKRVASLVVGAQAVKRITKQIRENCQ